MALFSLKEYNTPSDSHSETFKLKRVGKALPPMTFRVKKK